MSYLKSEQRHIITLFTDKKTEVQRDQVQLANDGVKTPTWSLDPKPIFLKFQAICPLISALSCSAFKIPNRIARSTTKQDHKTVRLFFCLACPRWCHHSSRPCTLLFSEVWASHPAPHVMLLRMRECVPEGGSGGLCGQRSCLKFWLYHF